MSGVEATCGVCGGPVKVRIVDVKTGGVEEPGETVWFELWGTGPYMHLACCDERGRPLEEKRKP